MVNFKIPIPGNQGCIIAACHTPWKRLLANWCLENNFGLLIGGGEWNGRRKFIQREGAGISELRSLIKYLQHKGIVITNADVFNNFHNCPVKFRGKYQNASLFSERLAMLAKVPIITVIPILSGTTLEFIAGPQFSTAELKSKSNRITPLIISFFEKEIEKNPAIWSYYVK